MKVFAKFDEIPSKTLQDIKETSSICLEPMKVFAKFDEIPSKTLQDIKETRMMFIKHYAPNRC